MNVIQNTPELLVIEDRPLVLTIAMAAGAFACAFASVSLFLSGAIFGGLVTALLTALAVWIVGFLAQRKRLFLDAETNLFSIRTQNLKGVTTLSYPLADLDRALVQESRSDGSSTYRLAYVLSRGMDRGTHPLTSYFTSGNGPRRGATAINDWLSARRA